MQKDAHHNIEAQGAVREAQQLRAALKASESLQAAAREKLRSAELSVVDQFVTDVTTWSDPVGPIEVCLSVSEHSGCLGTVHI